ncbi:MAG TPA: MurR/RpiR family transcriptional regulator [Candidatus Avoscillospira avicola]|uniref:MurR/RpiR family transcriptional regulator n=1 Tax=Candidatus Avoscillospira avicola TaxID=2840706 RepID=A0A9D1IWL3_9FIRM|nr:MurR/RpiR family transcriptional regulator [Candidatus Avoscillospira avicola]
MATDILSTIHNQMGSFSKGQRRIAQYIESSYDKAAFMTASRLGKMVSVSESTVVRFAVELGFDGYPSMQKALQEMVRNKLTSVQRIEVTNDRLGDQDVVSMVLQADWESIRMTSEALDRRVLDQAVEAILRAKNIYIVGVRSSAVIATFMSFYFRNIFDNVHLVSSSATSEMIEQMLHVSQGDVVIGISLPRYSSRTVQLMEFARDSGAEVVAITDSLEAPAAKRADHTLLAKSDMVSVVDSLVAPMSLVNALIVAIGQKKKGELSRIFENLEGIWQEYEVYERVEP